VAPPQPTQNLPLSAREYRTQQARARLDALAAVQRQWRRMTTGPDWDRQFARIVPTIAQIMASAQQAAAVAALAYVPDVVEDTGLRANQAADASEIITPLIGVAGDGRPVDTLAYGAVVRAGHAYDGGATAYQALTAGGQWLTMAMGTALSDTGREAESLAMGTRRVRTYVRMLVPPSCPRCALLAGQVYHTSQAFKRHPFCDCRNVPMAESVAGDATTDPHGYFQSLTKEQQDKVFGPGDAEAIRSGADIYQVVNAHRGVRLAQIGGRKVWVTSEGTTRRGFAYHRLAQSGGVAIDRTQTALRITRNGPELRTIERRRAARPRVMPSTLLRLSESREEYLRLLYANGYIL